ncbi:hypothetical protein [Haloferax sp. DFSO52]|uniref:hypothetical protein n=1 Tax=Haloferax sp. DFSO52 TaxID=3388505 RepID=UPI003A85EC44
MSRHNATTDAAVNGVAGLIIFSVGGAVASFLLTAFGPWLGFVPAMAVWAGCGYFGLKQFAHGIYTIVESASNE